jgi:dihydrofolate synthase/folylpolyglutamate synthase
MNAAIAIKTVEILRNKGYPISQKAISQGVKSNFVPGRIETINICPAMILDGGHNVEGIRVLTQFLDQKKMNNFILIFGVLKDKNYRKMISLLNPFIREVVVTEPMSERALPAEKLVKFFSHTEVQVKKNIREAWETAKKRSGKILVTGSLYLAGEMRNIIFGGVKNE